MQENGPRAALESLRESKAQFSLAVAERPARQWFSPLRAEIVSQRLPKWLYVSAARTFIAPLNPPRSITGAGALAVILVGAERELPSRRKSFFSFPSPFLRPVIFARLVLVRTFGSSGNYLVRGRVNCCLDHDFRHDRCMIDVHVY